MKPSDSINALPSPAQPAFSVTRKIRFGETDLAGIIYYPNYFNMFNEIVEDWFSEELGKPFSQLHQVDFLGIPIVHAECDFIAPSRLGESLTLSLSVARLGSTSLHLDVVGTVAQEVRIKAFLILVFIDLKTYRSVAPPEPLRKEIASRSLGRTGRDQKNGHRDVR